MAKNNNTTLWVLGAVAVVGYLAFRQGGALNHLINPAAGSQNPVLALPNAPVAQKQVIPGVVDDLPNIGDIGQYFPTLDSTGMQIQLY